jgi:hypothetical protein
VADTTPLPSASFPARCSIIQLNKLGSGMPTRRLASCPPPCRFSGDGMNRPEAQTRNHPTGPAGGGATRKKRRETPCALVTASGPSGALTPSSCIRRRKADSPHRQQRVCAVGRRRFPVGEIPTRQMLQPEATGATVEVTKRLKPSGNACHELRWQRECAGRNASER